jgi:hypothetical protein
MRTFREVKEMASQIRNQLVPEETSAIQLQRLIQLETLNYVLCDCGAGWVPDHKHSVECATQCGPVQEHAGSSNIGQEPAGSRSLVLCECGFTRLAQEHGIHDDPANHRIACPVWLDACRSQTKGGVWDLGPKE